MRHDADKLSQKLMEIILEETLVSDKKRILEVCGALWKTQREEANCVTNRWDSEIFEFSIKDFRSNFMRSEGFYAMHQGWFMI